MKNVKNDYEYYKKMYKLTDDEFDSLLASNDFFVHDIIRRAAAAAISMIVMKHMLAPFIAIDKNKKKECKKC